MGMPVSSVFWCMLLPVSTRGRLCKVNLVPYLLLLASCPVGKHKSPLYWCSGCHNILSHCRSKLTKTADQGLRTLKPQPILSILQYFPASKSGTLTMLQKATYYNWGVASKTESHRHRVGLYIGALQGFSQVDVGVFGGRQNGENDRIRGTNGRWEPGENVQEF